MVMQCQVSGMTWEINRKSILERLLVFDGNLYKYGIPCWSKRILKNDLIDDITSFLGEEDHGDFKCEGNGALARVGRDECTCIYALVRIFNIYRNPRCQVLKIDTTNNSRCFVGIFIHLV